MNSLIKKGILVVLVLVCVTAILSGCGTDSAKAISAPVRPLGVQAPHTGGIQLLAEEAAPETTVPETTEPETTEPETTEPTNSETEAPADGGIFQQILDWYNSFTAKYDKYFAKFNQFFDWFRLRVNYFFDVMMKEA